MGMLPSQDRLDPVTRVTALQSQFEPGLIGLPLEPALLTWTATSENRDACQVGYQVRRRTNGGGWSTDGPIAGGDSVQVPVEAEAPRSRTRREFAVRIATRRGWTAWSESVLVEAGLAAEDWSARAITSPSEIDGPVPIFRSEIALPDRVHRARLYVTALGMFDVRVNGRRVGDTVLAPGWTSYEERVLVDAYDVADLLRTGQNAIAVTVADGWYRGRLGFKSRTAIYGEDIGPIVQLEVEGQDGTVTTAVSDAGWRAGFGEVRSASIYDGTQTDLRRSAGDPSLPGFDDSDWQPARVMPLDPARLDPRGFPPVRVVAELPMSITRHGAKARLDGGQNISGWVRLTVRGEPGQTVTVRHAEVLEPDGALHLAALRTARATDTYVLDRSDELSLEPAFTFHGFRYADVETDAEILDAVAVVVSSDLRPRAEFQSSEPALDRFHANVVWSQRDNFVSLPTDCPQRDERLGWTGDAQAFAATANTLFDSASFWRSWLRDLEIDQSDEAGVPAIVPNIIEPGDMIVDGESADTMGRAGWADAATIVPMAVYESYGHRDVLRRQLRSMRRWVDHLRRRAGDDIVLPTEFQFGDWLDPDAPAGRPWEAKVSSDYVANAFYVHSARLLARAERLVGAPPRDAEYGALADVVAGEVWRRWSDEAYRTQTGAALALEFGIAPDDERTAVAAALAANVRSEDGRIATGFLGTPLVLFALSRSGHLDEAYRMLLRREAPSWLYQVDRGATTVWERWDAILPDGSIHSGEMDTREGDSMLSFNHYAYGAVVDWVYRTAAGLSPDPEDPGYRTVHVAPRPARSLTSARARIATAYGTLAIDWSLDPAGNFQAELDVPFGARALLDLPLSEVSKVTVNGAAAPHELRHGTHRLTVTAPTLADA